MTDSLPTPTPPPDASERVASAASGESRRVPLLHRAIGLVARAAAFALRILPGWLAYPAARLLALFIRPLIGYFEKRSARKGRGITRNLRIAFRDEARDPAFVRQILDGYARHLCRALVDLCRQPRVTAQNLRRHIEDNDSWRQLVGICSRPPLVGVTGHIGSPEMTGHASSLLGNPLHSLMRPIPIAPLDDLLRSLRTCGGQKLVTKWGAIREARKLLADAQIVAMLIDENEKRAKSAVFVPFLGTAASTPTSAALLHLRTGAPIIVGTFHPAGRDRWRFHLWQWIRHDPTGDTDHDVRVICEQINLGLSAAIRAYPAQWLWGMRRFATRPDGEVVDADDLPPTTPGAREAEEALVREVLRRDGVNEIPLGLRA